MTRILVVEDEESYRDPLTYQLEREGFDVASAATGPDALTAYDALEPQGGVDLVLLDLMLPGLDGTEVCRELRRRGDVPVIMLTAKDTEIDKVVGLELGADDYVTKPYSFRELLARMRAVLRRRAAAQPSAGAGTQAPTRSTTTSSRPAPSAWTSTGTPSRSAASPCRSRSRSSSCSSCCCATPAAC
ncbi:hypothetical protein GCM10025864_06570 [Luteimicrobium album]|uniref:Response regulatory domain-containing protein n=1 Tax=Luteimicrobium album TaxID=1054550 RepID=A0ABQ6HYY1_9MICO|nr:hypothetical protein GCM10025864_06570 [Luteimicrobium album]